MWRTEGKAGRVLRRDERSEDAGAHIDLTEGIQGTHGRIVGIGVKTRRVDR